MHIQTIKRKIEKEATLLKMVPSIMEQIGLILLLMQLAWIK